MEYKKSLLKNIRNFLTKRIDKVIAQQNLLTGLPLFFNMKKELEQALNNVELTYQDIVEIANELVADYTKDLDSIVKNIEDNIESLSNDDIRNLMLKLSIRAYSFGDVKERSAIKAECAEILKKEAYAVSFNSSEGSVAVKDNTSILNISNEIVSECIYNLVASLFKIKLDELRRVIDILKTILMSRLSEMKMSSSITQQIEDSQNI